MMMGGGGHGQVSVPPGFRFHPTDEELLYYYLRKKVSYESIDLDVIREVDLNKLEPWDLKEKCRIGSGGQNEWYFFSHKDKKYPTGSRTNRATTAGFWKATGRDKAIHLSSGYGSGSGSSKRIGMRKTLVFYTGRAPHGQKTDWIMHEYRLDDHADPHPHPDFNINNYTSSSSSTALPEVQEDGWVVCRVFKKKNQNRSGSSSLVQLQPEDEGEDHHHDHMNKLMLLQQGSHDHHVNPKQGGAAVQQLQAADPHNYQLIHTAAGSGTSSMFDHPHHHGSSCMHLPQLLSSPHDHDHHIPTSSLLSSSSSDLAAALDQQHTSTNCGCAGPGGLLLQQPQDHHHNNPTSTADWSFLDKLLASHSHSHHQQQHSQLGLLLAAEHSAPPHHQTKFNHHHHQLLIHPSSSSQSHPTPPPPPPPPHDHSSSHLFSFHYLNGHEN